FKAPSAFAQVVDALLRQGNFKASSALLMTWLSEADSVPLEEGDDSFHTLANRWLRDVIESSLPAAERVQLVARFFVHLEANADEMWNVPEWTLSDADEEEDEDETFEAAYEDVSYRDTTDDDEESDVAGGAPGEHFPLEEEGQRLEARLDFLTTVARMWQSA